jgi:mRNA interferase HigB
MKVIGRNKLDAFCVRHADARKWVEMWLADTEAASWATPQQLRNRYASACFLEGNTVIFNVKGNDYRLEVLVAYKTAVVVVQWIGTHAKYDSRNKLR